MSIKNDTIEREYYTKPYYWSTIIRNWYGDADGFTPACWYGTEEEYDLITDKYWKDNELGKIIGYTKYETKQEYLDSLKGGREEKSLTDKDQQTRHEANRYLKSSYR
jgi:hypothetical protein